MGKIIISERTVKDPITLIGEMAGVCYGAPVDDKEKMRKTLKWVQEMSKKEGCVEVLATHDPEVIPHVIEL